MKVYSLFDLFYIIILVRSITQLRHLNPFIYVFQKWAVYYTTDPWNEERITQLNTKRAVYYTTNLWNEERITQLDLLGKAVSEK